MIYKGLVSNLLSAVNAVSGGVSKGSTLPILSHICFTRAEGSSFTRVASSSIDQEQIVELSDELTGADEFFNFTVDAKKLQSILKSLDSDDVISLSMDKNRLALKSSSGSKFRLAFLDGKEFPFMVVNKASVVSFNLPSKVLKGCLSETLPSVENNPIKPFLSGVHMKLSGGDFACQGTNGHMLSVSKTSVEDAVGECENIVPIKVVSEILRNCSGDESSVLIEFYGSVVEFHLPSGLLIRSKVIEGKFPDTSRLISPSKEVKVSVERKVFIDVLQRAKIVSDEKVRGLSFTFNSDGILVQANNGMGENASELLDQVSVEGMSAGAELKVSFSVDYLLSSLQSISSKDCELLLDNNSAGSIHVVKPETDSYRFILMPMRL